MKQLPIEVPWKISASDEISEYRGGRGSLDVSVYTLNSGRVHREIVTEWEGRHQTAMPDRLYNERMGQMLTLHFEGVAFFCFSGLPVRLMETEGRPLQDAQVFHDQWNETGVCPDPGFYRIEESPLLARLCTRGERLTHWLLSAHDEELHILGRTWEALPAEPSSSGAV